jgi:hypothetical protein
MLYNDKVKICINHLEAKEKLVKSILHYNESSIVKQLEKLNIGRPFLALIYQLNLRLPADFALQTLHRLDFLGTHQ